MAEDRDGRVEAAARAAIKELQRQGADYSPYVDLRDEADPHGFMIDGEIDLVDLAKVIIAAADAVSGAEAPTALTVRQWGFLTRVRDGAPLGCADREEDKVRQQMRRAGYVEVLKSPRRWALTAAGRAALAAAAPPERGDG